MPDGANILEVPKSRQLAGQEFWDGEGRVAALCRLWDEGKTTAAIGRELGCSKNAVIGKLHRIDYQSKVRPVNERWRPAKAQGYALELVGPNDCLWPIGHPGEPHFRFCVAPRKAGSSYCADHHEIAWVKPPEPKPRHRAREE